MAFCAYNLDMHFIMGWIWIPLRLLSVIFIFVLVDEVTRAAFSKPLAAFLFLLMEKVIAQEVSWLLAASIVITLIWAAIRLGDLISLIVEFAMARRSEALYIGIRGSKKVEFPPLFEYYYDSKTKRHIKGSKAVIPEYCLEEIGLPQIIYHTSKGVVPTALVKRKIKTLAIYGIMILALALCLMGLSANNPLLGYVGFWSMLKIRWPLLIGGIFVLILISLLVKRRTNDEIKPLDGIQKIQSGAEIYGQLISLNEVQRTKRHFFKVERKTYYYGLLKLSFTEVPTFIGFSLRGNQYINFKAQNKVGLTISGSVTSDWKFKPSI